MDHLLEHVQAVLSTTVARWQTLTQGVAGDLLSRPPAAGEWSALDCLQHLVDTERRVFPVRIKAFLAGQDFPAFDPDSQGTISRGDHTPEDLAQEFARLRADNLALLKQVTIADLPRRVRHAELGPVTLSELLHEWAAHDLMHTVQAEQAVMQPFIAGCGPWQPYFAKHVVQGGSTS